MSKRELGHLAHIRTHLANERTFLAYVRTALAFIAGGLAILKFLPNHFTDAVVLIFIGVGFLAFGIWRYRKYRRYIDHVH